MKLRRALDKAENNRRNENPPITPALENKLQKSKIPQWDPPIYDSSVKTSIDLKHLRKKRFVCSDPDSPEMSSYKILRTEIQHKAQLNNWRTVLVTSALPNEGKTLTTINLGLSFALAYNQTVLLVDCDLKRQDIHNCLEVDSSMGIVDNIINEVPLQKVITWPGIEKFSFISGGGRVPNSAEVLGSPQMKALIDEMKSRYEDRIILIDCPPILSGADTVTLSQFVDCIIIVVHCGGSRIRDVKRALDMMPKEKVIGFVMNQQQNWKRDGYYYY